MEQIMKLLREHDIQPSFQRASIYKYLLEKKNHPTAETVFKDLVLDIPTLSKTTVYNTMKIFADKNLIIQLSIEENELRFDADISMHSHFKCLKCKRVYDIFEFSDKTSNLLNDYIVLEKQIYYKGICPKCQNDKEDNT